MGSGVFDHRDDPDDFGEQRRRLGSGAEISGHRLDECVGVVQQQRHQPIDPIAPDRDTGRPIGKECLSLPVQHRRQLNPMLLDRVGKPFLD